MYVCLIWGLSHFAFLHGGSLYMFLWALKGKKLRLKNILKFPSKSEGITCSKSEGITCRR